MKRYLYNYETIVSFSQPVTDHHILLRCQPMTGTYMSIEEEHLVVPHGFHVSHGVDAFGNRIVYGGQRDEHSALAYVSTGIVDMSPYMTRTPLGISSAYLIPTPLTLLSLKQAERESINKFEPGTSVTDKAMTICHDVYQCMEYMPLTTTIDTPASEIYDSRRGVCQDYAHLMIARCRLENIPARYISGFVEGTGETHAWVEIHDGYSWIGFDPTNDCRITYGYVKIAHGRDAADCPVNRGVYIGNAIQQTQINVTLKEL